MASSPRRERDKRTRVEYYYLYINNFNYALLGNIA